jgi:uncharacterized membrane protein YkoI
MKGTTLVAALSLFALAGTASAQAPQATAKKPVKHAEAAAPKYKRTLPKKLRAEAKITEAAAADAAMKAVPGAKIQSVELEKENNQLFYSYDMKTAGKAGVDEVHIDALTGSVLSNQHETPKEEKAEKKEHKAEKAEKKADKAAAKKDTVAGKKKP